MRLGCVISSLVFVALVLAKVHPHSGLIPLLRFGSGWESRHHASLATIPLAVEKQSNGYDGQFYAQLAMDPLLLHPDEIRRVIDAPAYRARRMLLPAAAAGFGFGSPFWTLQIYAGLNLVCWLVFAWIILREIEASGIAGFAQWFGCLFAMGAIESVRQSLVDLPAVMLIAFAVRLLRSEKQLHAGAALAAAALTKETSLLANLSLIRTRNFQSFARSAKLCCYVALPLLAWCGYVYWRLGTSDNESGFGNFSWPFAGLYRFLNQSLATLARGEWDGRYAPGMLGLLGLVAQIWSLLSLKSCKSPWRTIGLGYAALIPFLGDWVWSGYWAVLRAVLPMTVAFNLLLPTERPRRFWTFWTVGNISILHAIWRLL